MRFFFLIIFEHDFENILLLYFLKFNPQFNYFFFFCLNLCENYCYDELVNVCCLDYQFTYKVGFVIILYD